MIEYIFDPEIVSPSPEEKLRVDFWNRLSRWANDSRPVLGHHSAEALSNLFLNPPPSHVISPPDRTALLGKIGGRKVLPPIGPSNARCSPQGLEGYRQVLGDPNNRVILESDFRACGHDSTIVLATEEQCWPKDPVLECKECSGRHFYLYGEGLDAAEVAERDRFLQDSSCTLLGINGVAGELFPNIIFSDAAWDRASSLSGDSAWLKTVTIKHLSILNDSAPAIWSRSGQSNERSAALGSLGISASLESPKTRKSDKHMRLRDFDFSGISHRCEWHTKFQPNRGRIHFTVDKGTIFVGTIEEHLPTA